MALDQGVLFFLLPIAALSGWLIGRRARTLPNDHDFNVLNRDYLRGMNYLLSEQQDKAIEVFIHLAAVDNDTFETHLALGALFRRRGEVDRAIRIHQNLIARPTLASTQKDQALFELAHDYLKLGVLDRAEAILSELKGRVSGAHPVLDLLLQIYERERDWRNALATASLILSRSGTTPSISTRVAHYHCELAQQALDAGNLPEAQRMIQYAFRADQRCVRASLLAMRLALIETDYPLALRSALRILDQDAHFLPLVIDAILELYGRLGDFSGREAFFARLAGYRGSGDAAKILDVIRLRLKMKGDSADALRQYAKGYPTLEGLQEWLQLRLQSKDALEPSELMLFHELMGKILEGHPHYQCGHCGFSGRILHWQCPGCQQWGTIIPLACPPSSSSRSLLETGWDGDIRL